MTLRPVYKGPSLQSVVDLATLLEMEVEQLLSLCSNTWALYRTRQQPKKNGGVRTIYEPNSNLMGVQESILKRILRDFHLPEFLSAVPGRSYIDDSKAHAGKTTVMHEDIKDFYPSVTADMVMSVWHTLCGFPTELSKSLTELTTYRGFLPSGAPTSADLGNLVLFDVETELCKELKNRGLLYTRYVDDITISAKWKLTDKELGAIRELVHSMLRQKNLRPNVKKSSVEFSSGRMQVHGINVNRHQPTRSKQERANLRAAVHECERYYAQFGSSSEEYKMLYDRTLGRVTELVQVKPTNNARLLLARIKNIAPTT